MARRTGEERGSTRRHDSTGERRHTPNGLASLALREFKGLVSRKCNPVLQLCPPGVCSIFAPNTERQGANRKAAQSVLTPASLQQAAGNWRAELSGSLAPAKRYGRLVTRRHGLHCASTNICSHPGSRSPGCCTGRTNGIGVEGMPAGYIGLVDCRGGLASVQHSGHPSVFCRWAQAGAARVSRLFAIRNPLLTL